MIRKGSVLIPWLLFALGMVLFVGFLSIDSASNPKNIAKPVTKDLLSGIVDYGNGVYYIRHTESEFGNSLSAFIGEKNCDVKSITGNGNGSYGRDMGYFVICAR